MQGAAAERGKEPLPTPPFSFFAADPSKAYFERFSLVWTPASLVFLLAGVFGSGLWRHCGRDEYLAVSVAACVPGVVWPVLFPGAADAGRPYVQRFWVKAAVWIGVFSFFGNYFWTHYFYSLLGARYLFDSYLLNKVPVVTYLCTYFYFTFYFSFMNVVLRLCARALDSFGKSTSSAMRLMGSFAWALAVFSLSVLTAVFEAVSIQHFPLYTYADRFTFLTVGSVVYGIYFMVGFPMFFALDECSPANAGATSALSAEKEQPPPAPADPRCTMWYATQNSLAAVALVTLLLDLWRLFIGDIYGFKGGAIGVPFIYQPTPTPSYLDIASVWAAWLRSYAGI
jgi:cycloeucalenol cycloisomerase